MSGKGKSSAKGFNPKYIFLVVLSVVIIYLVYHFGFRQDEPVGYRLPTVETEKFPEKTEPQFTNEGSLRFLNSGDKSLGSIEIEIADNPSERSQGLMFRKSMQENQGMLFLFPLEEPQSFWMKNTHIPLDIIFVNAKKQIVKIHKNTKPFSEKSLPSQKPAKYVVEVNAGYTDKHGISEGDKIDWVLK
ncbi:MAG: DUF192 domain-containing protein [Ignavibacteriaceae bacterium]|nr:DUF192 domain-containing protein [Ignavibacteriaceae bacterium]